MSVTKISEAWERIEDWCAQNHPALLDELNGGASRRQVAVVEEKIQRPLPEDVRESLLLHNGQPDDTEFPLLFGQLALKSCDQIVEAYERCKGWTGCDPGELPTNYTFFPEEAITNCYHHDAWIPITEEHGNGNYLAVDLAPGPQGIHGQIIDFGADIYDHGVLAPSWADFLLSYAKLLESGLLGEFDTDPDLWRDSFDSLFEQNSLDALVGWVKAGRWPLK